MMATSVKASPIMVTIPTSLLNQRDEQRDEVQQLVIRGRIETQVLELLDDLDIDARPEVRLEVGTEEERYGVSVLVGGIPLRFPKELLAEASAYVDGVAQVTENADATLVALQPGAPASGRDSAERLGDVLANVCRSAISTRLELLLTGNDSANPGEANGRRELPMGDTSEARTIDVQIEPEYLSLLIADPRTDLFPFVRDGLFIELGLLMPPFHIVPDSSLKPGGFRFRINRIRTLPQIGLSADTILVAGTPEQLAYHGVDAIATLNPATWKPAALADRSHKDPLEELGFTTWDAWGFLILSFAAALRNSAYRLMTRNVATEMLSRLGREFPVLARAVDAYVPTDVMSSVLRELLLDGVSIRNLRQIVEFLLKYETNIEQAHNLDRVSFVRAGMADAIAEKLSRSTGTVVVYLIDSQIEHAVLDRDPDPALPERLLAATRDKLAHLPPMARTPAILTRPHARARVRELLRGELPYVPVVAYGELPLSCNIKPIARLSLP